jgi:glutathione S-transferase
MLQLIQFPWSPFCLAQKRILEYSGTSFKVVNIPPSDRSLVWRLTRQRYYMVPVLKDGASVIFETDENSQVIAKYIDSKLNIGLFPHMWDGIQRTIWFYIENEIESVSFKLNDIYWREIVPASEQLAYLRHKERKFGPGCLEQWFKDQKQLLAALTQRLTTFEQMLEHRNFLLDGQPRFIDFELWGMMANLLYSGHYELPVEHPELKKWFAQMSKIKFSEFTKK